MAGRALLDYATWDVYIGGLEVTLTKDLITLTASPNVVGCSALSYTIAHDAPASTVIAQNLPTDVTMTMAAGSSSHTINLTLHAFVGN